MAFTCSAECNDSRETSVAMSLQPNSTVQCIIPIRDWKYDARSGSSLGLTSICSSYLVENGLGDNFGNIHWGGKCSDM